MKFNILFFSTIIIIKAKANIEHNNNEFEVDETFQYVPSIGLHQIENNLPTIQQEFIDDGMVKETMTNMFKNSMKTDVAKDGVEKLNKKIQILNEGLESMRVVNSFSKNFREWAVSTDALDIIKILMTMMKNLLANTGKETRGIALTKMLQTAFNLLGSSKMPGIVNMTGGLVMTAVNKPGAPQFVIQCRKEINDLLGDKNLITKVNMSFKNMISIMHMIDNQN